MALARDEFRVAFGWMARVRLFASLREIAGASQLDVEGETVGDVVAALAARYGQGFTRRLETARIWKNGDEAAAGDPVTATDELAVIPPVSGGAAVGIAGSGLESLVLVGLVAILLGANALSSAVLAAAWVGVTALWVIDLARSASDGDFRIDYPPLLAAILVSMSSSITFGPSGLGVGVAISMVMVMGWAIVQPRARDLTIIVSSVLCALIASLSVGSIMLARASAEGDRKVAGLLIIAVLGALTGRVVERSRARIADPYLTASIITVLAALAVAYLSDFELLGWFFIGLVLAGGMIAGRGIGSAFRTGRIQLAVRPDGFLAALDGPMVAVAAFMPVVWLIS